MAALNFPNNPAVNDTYFANDTTWQFNGSSWVRINTGVQGVTGVQGTQGTQGTQGIQGTNGVQGTDGTQGTQGAQGFNGTLGSQGTQGAQGIQGLQGPSFSRANYSFTATSGQTTFNVAYVVGANVDVYVNGSHLGPSDYTATNGTDIVLNDPLNLNDSVEISTYTSGGPQGTQGIQGVTGAGTQGAQGIQGIQASQGTDGTQGTQGAQGFNGTLGSQGTQGIQGATGSQGTQGATGTQGIQGQIGNIFWETSAAGISTTSEVGINTTGLPSSLTGVGNSFQGLYISNGMVIHDNVLNGDHYIGTAFNGLMAGPVTINGVLTVDGNYVVV